MLVWNKFFLFKYPSKKKKTKKVLQEGLWPPWPPKNPPLFQNVCKSYVPVKSITELKESVCFVFFLFIIKNVGVVRIRVINV